MPLSVPELFAAIRRRRGETMVEFGRLLGVSHAAISGYESGKIEPSRTILLLVGRFAEGIEKEVLYEILGKSYLQAGSETDPDTAGQLADITNEERRFLADMLRFFRSADERVLGMVWRQAIAEAKINEGLVRKTKSRKVG